MSHGSDYKALRLLCLLTLLAIIAQIIFVYIHYKTNGLVDTLVASSLPSYIFTKVVLYPILQFIIISMLLYAGLIAWAYYLIKSLASLRILTKMPSMLITIIIWCLLALNVFSANNYFYPHSFFAVSLPRHYALWILMISAFILLLATSVAIFRSICTKRYLLYTYTFLAVLCALCVSEFYHFNLAVPKSHASKPNIIIVGFDSLRPDFISHFGGRVATPNIDRYLADATVFSQAYTPLARTFPSWVSLLTSLYPMHSHARNNLVDLNAIQKDQTLAKQLQAAGYHTIYATDEKRFSNITQAMGFDTILGPKMGLDDFILGQLADFPVTNLMVNLSIGKYLFPYQHANRAAAVTYYPNSFLQLLQHQLTQHNNQPLFLAVHFCITHWPYTWAQDGSNDKTTNLQNYVHSIQEVDKQFARLLVLLKQQKLLSNTIVVMISDHGTGLGLHGDQIVTPQSYLGNKGDIKKIPIARLNTANRYSIDFRHDYSIDTAYGQGTSVLSLVQHRILFAMRGFGIALPLPQQTINARVSILDIAPTLLQLLHLPAFAQADGISLAAAMQGKAVIPQRTYYFETGDKMSSIETDHISPEKVIQSRINAYVIDAASGRIFLSPPAERSLIRNKQLGVMMGDWLLVEFPTGERRSLLKIGDHYQPVTTTTQPFEVLVNMSTGKWSIGAAPALIQATNQQQLRDKIMQFYFK